MIWSFCSQQWSKISVMIDTLSASDMNQLKRWHLRDWILIQIEEKEKIWNTLTYFSWAFSCKITFRRKFWVIFLRSQNSECIISEDLNCIRSRHEANKISEICSFFMSISLKSVVWVVLLNLSSHCYTVNVQWWYLLYFWMSKLRFWQFFKCIRQKLHS